MRAMHVIRRLLLGIAVAIAAATVAGYGTANAQVRVEDQTRNAVTAIDILLEPDAVMLKRAEADNARLLKAFPQGFALDAAHRPHITLLQTFVRTADLDKVEAAARQVIARSNIHAMQLEAYKRYYIAMNDTGVAGIVARPTPELVKLQADIIAAVAPYAVATGGSNAFVTTSDDPIIDPALIDYVSKFTTQSAGAKFNPHVSTGVAPRTYLDPMVAEAFEPFTFSPAGAAIYQLGQFGTAAKQLSRLDNVQ
ncbi:2'-5' RNA ligase family protein [Sandaracinobacteroides hominis]|uniref:2'-5' RNA ligase family protein n=1 Tax=Sandaracinobacteroides hominis TaxID=2780086 RepID=UPI001A9C4620|nr:2'-5' RNA ligase family protein [Sandaracinobacteroides hominis]